jgi:hypothetical protein
MSSAVTQVGKLPRKMVKLILKREVSVVGNWEANGKGKIHLRRFYGNKFTGQLPRNKDKTY